MGTEFIFDNMKSAFDLSSCGMGIQSHAIEEFATRQPLKKWAIEALSTNSSNYLAIPSIQEWTRPGTWRKDIAPKFRHPNSNLYTDFIKSTQAEYDGLDWELFRLSMAGEVGLKVEDPTAAIETESIQKLLIRAKEQGYVDFSGMLPPSIAPESCTFYLLRNMLRSGIEFSDSYFEDSEKIRFSERYRNRTLQAGIHKLGCMLAVTDQLVYDALGQDIHVPAIFKPQKDIDLWETNWQKLFNEQLPTIKELFTKARDIYSRYLETSDTAGIKILATVQIPQFAN